MNVYRLSKFCLIVLVTVLHSVNLYAQTYEVKLNLVKSIELDKGSAYESLVSSERFVAWFEHYSFSVYTVDIESGKQNQIKLTKGRGPGEVTWIKSAAILGDQMLIYDFGSMKIVYFDLETGSFVKEQTTNMILQALISDGRNLFGSGLSPNGYFFKYESVSKAFKAFPNSILPFLDSFNMADPSFNPFRIQGTYTTCDGCIIFNGAFEPVMYIYDIGSQVVNRYKYEDIPDVDFESGRTGNILESPRPVEMYIDKVSRIDSKSIAVLARGKSAEREYSSKTIHVFNIDTRTHESRVTFPHEISDMSISDSYFVTLSKETWSVDIYRYELE